ncbi:ParA family protein [Kocuria sp.]|uniref:ParA family protein n=1 Tax=Kocuria sp. TaxID=1871328 RepID=UPI0028AC6C37|nr:ParA family protein [Kocuria sp.]
MEENKRRAKLKNVHLDRPGSTRYITISNQKGGVGKTSTSVNLAVALAQQGQNVMVVDNDPQGNASTALGIPHGADADSVYDVLIDEVPVAEVVKESPEVSNLWVLPATIDLAGAEIELVSVVAREQRLQRALAEYAASREEQGLPRLDYVFIDCPPSLGLLTINAFVAATEVLIPIQCEYYALEGLSQLLNNIAMIQKHLNPKLVVSSILLTMYDGRTNLASQVADEVRQHFPREVMETMIPRSVRVSEAPSYQQSVITYDPSSTGALSYLEAAAELASRGSGAAE